MTIATDQPVQKPAETYGREPVLLPFSGIRCCARCIERVAFAGSGDCWTTYLVSVPWPCTSAIVLGLVPREEAQ